MEQKKLEEILKKAKLTKILDLTGEKLDKEDIFIIAATIPDIEDLIAINLTETSILPEYVSILAESIGKCKNLLYLDLTLCNINDQSSTYLLNAVKNHPSLISLELADNKIKEGKLIADLVSTNHRLLSLNLFGNKLGMEGKTILNAVKKNSSLMSCNVICTNMFIEIEDAINEKVAQNRKDFKEKVIKQNDFKLISIIPGNLVEYRDSLISKSVERPIKLSLDPIIYIGQWQEKIGQQEALKEIKNTHTSLNTLTSYSKLTQTKLPDQETEKENIKPKNIVEII